MPIDQPENPRIRTKVARLDRHVDQRFFEILERLRAGEIDVDGFQSRTLGFLEEIGMADFFADDIEAAARADDQHWLMRRHVDHCRYTILFFRVDPSEVHPPHHHHNLISTQIVMRGRIHLREYERVARDETGQLSLRLVNDAILGPGEAFQASEWKRNVHWFCALDEPAVLFNINARGYERTTFDATDDGPFGRRYLDPTHFDENDLIVCEEFDEAEAERRFQGRRLSEFPAPPPGKTPDAQLVISL